MAGYRCPVCNKPLSKQEFEAALGILDKREAHLRHLQEELKAERDNLRKQIRNLPNKIEQAKVEGRLKERQRAERLMQGQRERIKRPEERIAQLQRGSTPQTEGLEFEEGLAARLRKHFREDGIHHKGRGGDVLHFVTYEKKRAGVIVYECKRTPKITSAHIDQAYRAKQAREADFVVLVTTGQRTGFTGLTQIRGVLVVAPLGVIPLAALLRAHLVEMLKIRMTRSQRIKIAERLLEYVTSPQFKNPIEEVMGLTNELQQMILDEFKSHRKMWERRWDYYQRIHWDTNYIHGNLQLVLQGKLPRPVLAPRREPLQLPPPTRREV
jgi:hypothetical protein